MWLGGVAVLDNQENRSLKAKFSYLWDCLLFLRGSSGSISQQQRGDDMTFWQARSLRRSSMGMYFKWEKERTPCCCCAKDDSRIRFMAWNIQKLLIAIVGYETGWGMSEGRRNMVSSLNEHKFIGRRVDFKRNTNPSGFKWRGWGLRSRD